MKIERIRNCLIFNGESSRLVDLQIRKGKIYSITTPKKGVQNSVRDYDAKGSVVIPGLADCHAHLFSLALKGKKTVELEGSKSIREMQFKIMQALKRNRTRNGIEILRGDWLIGRGWDQDRFVEGRMPGREDIDEAVNDHPTMLTRVCGHIAVLNSLALSKVKKELRQFLGTELFPVDEEGKPAGIVKELALEACQRVVPRINHKELISLFLKCQAECLSFGLTSVHCILSEDWKKELHVLRALRSRLKLKISVLLPISAINQIESMQRKERRKLLRGRNFFVIGFKLYSDGSLGARTAALSYSYSDEPGNLGILYYTQDEISKYALRVKKLGLILATHAIGDRAIDTVLSAYKDAGITREDGFRIEHYSIVTPKLVRGSRSVTVCIQPMFPKSDYWIKRRIGASRRQERFAYPFRSLFKNTLVIGGSDAPVETIDPLESIRSAMKNGRESLSFSESLALYTVNAARTSELTRDSGEIARGKICDLAILDSKSLDEFKKSARVNALFVDGKIYDQSHP